MKKPKVNLAATRLDAELHRPRLKSGIVPSDTRIYVRVMQGTEAGKVFDLSAGGCYLIGRGAGDIALSDAKVSYRHAELKVMGPEAYFIIDLASTNGTFLNGNRVERRKFQHCDELRVGDTVLHIDIFEGTVPVSPTRS
jgi:predicted component of type VI protein secretion system